MGQVWAAINERTGGAVALKFLTDELAASAVVKKRFLREARAASAVNHPNVVGVHDVIEDAEAPVLVMDLLDGEPLSAKLRRDGALGLHEAAGLLLPVVSAMSAAHAQGVVHRDLKPDNIFLARGHGGRVEVKVLDFGLAKLVPTEAISARSLALTESGAMLGTPYYMSPEQAWGEKDVDALTDVWSLGIILYECLAGRRPTEADNLGQIIKTITTDGVPPLDRAVPSAPPDLAAIVGRMLERDRARRLADLSELSRVLERHAAPSPEGAQGAAVAPLPPPRAAASSHPALAETIPSSEHHGAGASAPRRRPDAKRPSRAWAALALPVVILGTAAALRAPAVTPSGGAARDIARSFAASSEALRAASVPAASPSDSRSERSPLPSSSEAPRAAERALRSKEPSRPADSVAIARAAERPAASAGAPGAPAGASPSAGSPSPGGAASGPSRPRLVEKAPF